MPASILIIDADAAAARVTKAGIERSLVGAQREVRIWPLAAGPPCDPPPGAVIIDPASAVLRSVRFMQRLREDSPATRIIVLASAATPALRTTAQALGVDAYLEKPIALPGLLRCIQQILSDHHQAQEDEPLKANADIG